MPRVKSAVAKHRRKKRVMKEVKGFWGARGRWWRMAQETLVRARAYAFRDRRNRKREFRALWITRITAACRARDLSYSLFIAGLKGAQVVLDRRMLADIAARDPKGFDRLVEVAKGTR